MRRWRAFWTPLRVVDAILIFSVIYVTIWSLHPSLLVSNTLITGGDTGSHLALPAYLRTTGNLFDLTPWYPGWFAGMPAYTYYFVLPDFLATLASYVIGFAVAFKLATVLGSVLMPITAYAMGRLFRAPRPIPVALAMATLPFLFDASFTIDGGNLFSTMAGEYAFSLSLALALLTIGLFARGVREGRGYWVAGLSLSLTLAAHVLPWFYALGAVAVLVVFELLQRRGHGDPNDRDLVRGDFARPVRFAVVAGLNSLGFSAWWLFSFATTQSYSNSMGYTNDDVSTFHSIFTYLGWFNASSGASPPYGSGDRWVIILAAVAIVVAFVVRDRLGMVLAVVTALSFGAFVFDPQSVIWNERLIPYWYISIHLAAGWVVGYGAYRWAQRSPRFERWVPSSRDSTSEIWASSEGHEPVPVLYEAPPRDPDRLFRRTFQATVAVGVLGLLSTVPALIPPVAKAMGFNTSGNQVTNWAQYNYAGYQAQAAWPEYHDIMTTMARVASRYGCGRAMWEYNSSEGRFGTPEALMLLPYWTDNCVGSMEGLLFESSATTPYHFLDQSELSASPSDAQVGLEYQGLNVQEGVRHLQILGVKYYIAFTPSVVAEANADSQLRLVASTKAWPSPGVTWRIYLIKHSPMVQSLAYLPTVVSDVSSRVNWLAANQTWWLNEYTSGMYGADAGPVSWPRSHSISALSDAYPQPSVTVTHVRVGLQSLSFHVDRVGVPMLVKISYFPRWHVTGASGPYRVSPNLMVVVPTQRDVSLTYGSTPALVVGNVVTDATVVAGAVVLWMWLKRRRIARR